jgi:multiple sugar transport system substrate-binding protein
MDPIQNPQPTLYPQTPMTQKLSFKTKILKKRKFILIAVGILILVLVSSIITLMLTTQKAPTTTIQPVTITFWGRSVDESVMNEVIKEFELKNPLIKVKYEKQTPTQYKERLAARLNLKNPANLPDVMEIDEAWVDEFTANLLPFNGQNFLSNYSSIAVNNNKVGEVIYGMPYRFDSLALVYNKQYIDELGLSETDFTKLDWSSLVNRAQKLTKTQTVKLDTNRERIDIKRAGIAIGSPVTVKNATNILELLLLQNDANIYNPTTKQFKLDQKFTEVITFYTNFAKDRIWEDALGNDIEAFANGKVAMVLASSADIDTIKSKNPTLQFGTVMAPRISSIKNISISTSVAAPAVGTNPTQVVKFLDFLSRPEIGTYIFENQKSSTFVPSQQKSLNDIPASSPFAVFSNINPTAQKFLSPRPASTFTILEDFLTDSFIENFKNGLIPKDFKFNGITLEKTLNEPTTLK